MRKPPDTKDFAGVDAARIDDIRSQLNRRFVNYPESKARAKTERKLLVGAIDEVLENLRSALPYPNLISNIQSAALVRTIRRRLKLE